MVSGSGLPDDSHSPNSADFYEGAAPRNVVYIPETEDNVIQTLSRGLHFATLPDFPIEQNIFFCENNEKMFVKQQREKENVSI